MIKSLRIWAMLVLLFSINTYSQPLINENEYVLNYLSMVFCPTQVSNPTFFAIHHYDTSVANDIITLHNTITNSWSFWFANWSGAEAINPLIKEAIISFVNEESYNIAYAISNNRAMADKISGTIVTEINSFYNRLPHLTKSVFREYAGVPLNNKVQHYYDKLKHQAPAIQTPKPTTYHQTHSAPQAQQSPILSYSAINNSYGYNDKTCPICQYNMNDFNDRIALPIHGRIALTEVTDGYAGNGYILEYSTCGHSMHAKCAQECFFNHALRDCPQPQCDKRINKELLAQILQVNHRIYIPSAPTYNN